MDVVTGAFSYTGSYIARHLLEQGREVTTLSRAPAPGHPLAGRVRTAILDFRDPVALAGSLRGASTLYNTYWVRFPYGDVSFGRAVENTVVLFLAARRAGVRRVVHFSVTNPSLRSPLAYFRAKARVEEELRASGLSHAVVRPTLVFGSEDVLVNNIAWILRRFPVFILPARGDYRLQPVSAEDTATLAVDAAESGEYLTLDAAGPEVYTFEGLVRLIAAAVGSRARIVHASPSLALLLAGVVGRARRDVLLTRDELEGLMASLLVSYAPARGRMSFRAWVSANGARLGAAYVSELERNYRVSV